MGYPKPEGWVGSGADGKMIRQGSGGHLGWNPATETGEKMYDLDRRNATHNDGDCFSDYEDCEN